MYAALVSMIDRLESTLLDASDVIRWGSPVPTFGNLENSTIATLGLNPSNREFMDENGIELDGESRRFHTLRSLQIDSWAEADYRHLQLIDQSCRHYFQGNPYDPWFRRLDYILSATGCSYYDVVSSACHLDVIPFATRSKWTELSGTQRKQLLSTASQDLALLLKDSPVTTIVLNGRSVITQFVDSFEIELEQQQMNEWALPRGRDAANVPGYAYVGRVHKLGSVPLQHELLILGYNHNIQSSFGVTKSVMSSIRTWVSEQFFEHRH